MQKISFYVYLISLFVFYSCARHSLYVPTITNTPNFDGTNKYQANAALGFDHFELQTAANPIKGLGLMHNIYYSNRGRNVDLAVGYTRFDSIKKLGFDLFVGYGTGERKYTDKTKHLSDQYYTFFDIDNSFKKYFTQATVFKKINKHHQLGFTFRACYINYNWFNYDINYTIYDDYFGPVNKLDQMKNEALTVSSFDYILTYKYRYRFVGVFVQGGLQITNGPENAERNLYYSYPNLLFVNSGVNFYFNSRKRN